MKLSVKEGKEMKCDNCKNKQICKYVDYMQNVENQLNNLELNKSIFIGVDIRCGYMQEKNCVGMKPQEFPKDIIKRPSVWFW